MFKDSRDSDQRNVDTQNPCVVSETDHCQGANLNPSVGLAPIENTNGDVSGCVDHSIIASRCLHVDTALIIAEIREQWRRRQAWHRAEKSLTLQAKALCRRLAIDGDKGEAEKIYKAALGKGSHPLAETALSAIFPLVEGRKAVETSRKAVEKRLAKLAAQLPAAGWVANTRGFGIASLAAIVGEAGDLRHYTTVAKLWKRMGLAVMPSGRQRKVTGAEGIEHGYSPTRRSVVWTIGDCIIKAGGPYKELYNERKLYEAERVETKAHAHNRAKRYMEKRLLRDLWVAWRGGDHQFVDLQRDDVAAV